MRGASSRAIHVPVGMLPMSEPPGTALIGLAMLGLIAWALWWERRQPARGQRERGLDGDDLPN